jgi:hypothetical protein
MTDPNRNGQACVFQAMTPIAPGKADELRAYLERLRERGSPFAKLPRTHMGRFVIVEDFAHDRSWRQRKQEHLDLPYLIFTSNFDGDLDSYLDELCDVMADEAKQIWGRCIGCPERASGRPLRDYLEHNQIDCGFFYAAVNQSTVADIQAALAQRDKLIGFVARTQGMQAAALQRAFVNEFRS